MIIDILIFMAVVIVLDLFIFEGLFTRFILAIGLLYFGSLFAIGIMA